MSDQYPRIPQTRWVRSNRQPQTKKQTPQIMALESVGLGTWWWNLATDEVVCDSRFKSLIGIPQNEPNILVMSSILAHFQVADVRLTQSAIKELVNTRRI